MGSVTDTKPAVYTIEGRPVPGPPVGKGKLGIRPAHVPSDVRELGLLGRICFEYSSRLLFPTADPNDPSTAEDEIRWRAGRIVNRVRNGNPLFVAQACNDDTPTVDSVWRIAGVAQWKAPKREEAKWKRFIEGGLNGVWTVVSGQEGEYKVKDGETERKEFPESMDIAKYDELMAIIQREEKKMLDEQGVEEEDVWYLQTLATHPDFKRRGIGKELLQWGIERGREDKTHVFLTATPEGRFLYKSQGFVELGEFDVGGTPHFGMMWFYKPPPSQDGAELAGAEN